MDSDRNPSDSFRIPVCTTLFCLCDAPGADRSRESEREVEGQGLEDSFARLLSRLDFSSTCYLISREGPEQGTCFDRLLSRVSSFLEEHRFLQVSLRPVHPFSGEDAEEWVAAYLRFLRACKPFQEEGYREQIIARLRVFPVVFLKNAEAVRKAIPFLSFLEESFFLPSLLLPSEVIGEAAALRTGKGAPPWVRIYATDASIFDPEKALEILHVQEVCDRLVEDDSQGFSDGGDLSDPGSLILDAHGEVRSAPVDSLLSTLHLAGSSYRANPQGAPGWHRLCDRMAARFVGKGMYDQAIQAWRGSIHAYPAEAVPSSLHLQVALAWYEKGDLEAMMKELAKARKIDPLSADIRYYMGQCEFGWRDYIEAADRFREAIELGLTGPLRKEAHYYRGLSHYHLEEYADALGPLAEAESAGMTGSPLPFYQGLCLLGKGAPDQALVYLQEALSRGPTPDDLFHVLFYIAHAYKEMEDFQNALAACEKAEEAQPDSYELWNLKGFCHFKQQNHDAAIACFEKALEIDPGSGIDYANIGSNLRDKGDVEGAIAMYRKALSLDPTLEFAQDNLKRLERLQKEHA